MEFSSRCGWAHSALPSRHSAPDFGSSSNDDNTTASNNDHDHHLHHHHHHNNNNHPHHHQSPCLTSTHSGDNDMHPALHKKRSGSHCHLCGKRLLKLAGWRNYFTLPCRCRHVFCKQCITGRLQCRQKVMRSASYDLMWTFPCPGSAQCGQELNVDWSRGSSYSKNLVARDLGSTDDSYDQEDDEEEKEEKAGEVGEEEADEESVFEEESDVSENGHQHHDGVPTCGAHSSVDPMLLRKSVHFEI